MSTILDVLNRIMYVHNWIKDMNNWIKDIHNCIMDIHIESWVPMIKETQLLISIITYTRNHETIIYGYL